MLDSNDDVGQRCGCGARLFDRIEWPVPLGARSVVTACLAQPVLTVSATICVNDGSPRSCVPVFVDVKSHSRFNPPVDAIALAGTEINAKLGVEMSIQV
jgi:hypothetical protein